MAAESDSTTFRKAIIWACGVVAVLLALLSLWVVRDMLILALVALFIAVSLDPFVRWMVRRGIKRPYAVTLMILITIAVVGTVMALLMPPLISEASQISKDLPGYVSDLDQRSRTFRELSTRYGLDEELTKLANELPGRIGTSAVNFFRRFLGVLASTLLVFVLAIYFMADLPRIRRVIPQVAPRALRHRTRHVVDVVFDKVGAYMIGGLLVSFIAGIVTYIGLTVLKVPFALPLAMFVFICAFIPLIGASIGAIVCVIVAGIANGLWPSAALVALLFIVYQQLENYIIAPRVMQRSVNLPAVGVLLAGLLGATLLGLIGALMAIPIAAAIKAVIVEIRNPSPDTDEEDAETDADESPPAAPPPPAPAPA
jgi:predicted PurR-regulated permease PerM